MKIFLSLLIPFISLLSSCTKNTIYSNYYIFNENKWHADSTIIFEFNSLENKKLNINLSINYTVDYPFQNFYSSYSLLDSNKKIINSKMIEFDLFDKKFGIPKGSGLLKQYTIDSLVFQIDSLSKQSKYTFLIKQSMRKEILNGINSIGLIITND